MIDGILDAMQQGGWDKFEALPQASQQQREQIRQQALARAAELAGPFSSDAGRAFLAALERAYINVPHMLPLAGAHTAEQQALFAAYRQGQKDVVASIANAVAAVRGGDPKVKKGEA